MMTLDAFATTVYRKPEVADACLRLQQELGVDVPILLFCAWFGCVRGDLDNKMLAQVIKKSRPYSTHVVKSLREARRWMKQPDESQNSFLTTKNQQAWQSLREQIKSIEISAELLWLDGLQSLSESMSNEVGSAQVSATSVMGNMLKYCLSVKSESELKSKGVPPLLEHIAVACEHLAGSQADRSS